jgi:cobalt/nickel transport system permease protein
VLPVLLEGGGVSDLVWAGDLVWDGGFIVITHTSLVRSLQLTARAMGSLSCLYFLSLTTPMVDLISQLRAWHFPLLLLELMELVYRFLFVTLDISRSMIKAQQMRLGYRDLRTGLRSLGQGLAVLLSRTFQRSNMIYSALECRLYSGSLASLPGRHRRSLAHEFIFAALFAGVVLLAVLKHVGLKALGA